MRIRKNYSSGAHLNKLLILILLVTVDLFAGILEGRRALVEHTIPMENQYNSYEKHPGVLVSNIKFENNFLIFNKNDVVYKFYFNKIGAKFSHIGQVTGKVNIYTLFNQVHYIEKQEISENYTLGFFIGNSFLKDESFTSLEVDLEYLLSDNSRLGSYCNHYLGRGQTNLALFYKYKYSNNINMRAGLDLNYMNSDWALMEKYSYPDENKIYKIKNSFSASFFIEPGIEFNQGNLYIRQTVVTNFIFLSGNVTGLAYHFRPVINIGYRIF